MEIFFFIALLLGYGFAESAGALALFFALVVLTGLSLRLACRVLGSPEPDFEQFMDIGWWAVVVSGLSTWALLAFGAADWAYLLILPMTALVYCAKMKIEFSPALLTTAVQFALVTLVLLPISAFFYWSGLFG